MQKVYYLLFFYLFFYYLLYYYFTIFFSTMTRIPRSHFFLVFFSNLTIATHSGRLQLGCTLWLTRPLPLAPEDFADDTADPDCLGNVARTQGRYEERRAEHTNTISL